MRPYPCLRVLLCLLLPVHLFAQAPIDNPYTTKYGSQDHWTQAIKWKNVLDATAIPGLIGQGNKVDSAIVHRTIKKLSSRGGGVLYFPAGTYYFNYNLRLESGVVIRGADPEGINTAITEGYKPPTRFEFPKYVPVLEGCGTPNSTAFKSIYGDTVGIRNAGLVNLDINRATIHFLAGGYYTAYTLQGKVYWCKYRHDNLIVFGIRQNNAAIPSPDVPTLQQVKKNQCWQRWPYSYMGNINMVVSTNCLVANCRLNDEITDNFEQPGYVDDMEGVFDGRQAIFSYTDHPGICINAYKISSSRKTDPSKAAWGPYQVLNTIVPVKGFQKLDSASDPLFYSPGKKEVLDNYIMARGRHKKLVTFWENSLTTNGNVYKYSRDTNYIFMNGMRSRLLSSPGFAQNLFEKKLYVASNGRDSLQYLIKQPSNNDPNKKYPLILFFHAEDNSSTVYNGQLSMFIPMLCTEQNLKDYPCFILAPLETKDDVNTWVLADRFTHGIAMQLSKKVLDETIANNNVDPNRIYVIGISRGGTAAWKFASRYAESIAAVVGLDGIEDGFTDEEFETFTTNKTPFWTAAPRAYGHLSLFVDTRLNIMRLRKAGNNAVFKYVGGTSREDMLYTYYSDPEFLPWLFANKKN